MCNTIIIFNCLKPTRNGFELIRPNRPRTPAHGVFTVLIKN